MKKSKVPTITDRFKGVIEEQTDTAGNCAVLGIAEAADACTDIHRANILELLEDAELLIDPAKAADFQELKKQYTA